MGKELQGLANIGKTLPQQNKQIADYTKAWRGMREHPYKPIYKEVLAGTRSFLPVVEKKVAAPLVGYIGEIDVMTRLHQQARCRSIGAVTHGS